jgi:hypothetical protein
MRTKVDLDQLRIEIRAMTRTHALYRLLRDELSALGFWRNRPRGNPAKGFRKMKEKIEATE